MRNTTSLLLIGLGLALVVALNTFFTVPQTHQALVLRFGAPARAPITAPGLYVRAPFIDTVIQYDRRNLGLTLSEPLLIVAADQERLVVDAFVRWRIDDPLRFYQAVQTEEGGRTRLEGFTQSALRRVLGSVSSNDIIRIRRAQLMQAIETDLNREAATELGARIIDVRIRQADLPDATLERVFERMRTERQQVAAQLRAEGQEQALRIRAEADREVTIIAATARETAERTRGEGDGRRARIFAQAYGRNAEFAAFYRSLQAYERALPAGTQMVIPPDGDFFRYMQSQTGRGR